MYLWGLGKKLETARGLVIFLSHCGQKQWQYNVLCMVTIILHYRVLHRLSVGTCY